MSYAERVRQFHRVVPNVPVDKARLRAECERVEAALGGVGDQSPEALVRKGKGTRVQDLMGADVVDSPGFGGHPKYMAGCTVVYADGRRLPATVTLVTGVSATVGMDRDTGEGVWAHGDSRDLKFTRRRDGVYREVFNEGASAAWLDLRGRSFRP